MMRLTSSPHCLVRMKRPSGGDSGWTLPVVVTVHCQPSWRRRHPLLRTSIATRCALSTTTTATTAAITTMTGPVLSLSKKQWWGRQRFDCWSSRICSCSSRSTIMAVSFSWQPMKRCNFWASAAAANAAAGNSPERQFASTSKRRTNDKHIIRKAAKTATEKPPLSQQQQLPKSMIRLMFCYSKLDVEAHWNMFGDMIRQQMAASSGNGTSAAVSVSTPLSPLRQRDNSNVHTTTNDYDHSDDDAFDERIFKCPLHWPSILALAQQEYPTDSKDAMQLMDTVKLEVATYTIDRSTTATTTKPIQSSSPQARQRPLTVKQQLPPPPRAPRLEWMALTSLDDLTLGLPQGFVVANRIPILLRHPSFYQESSLLQSRQNRSSTATTRMEHAVYGLLYELKETGHVRHSQGEMMKLASPASNKSEVNQIVSIVATRDWVLQMASKQEALQDLLLSQPGALDHIVSCLHHDYLWQNQPDEHNDSDGDGRNDDDDGKMKT